MASKKSSCQIGGQQYPLLSLLDWIFPELQGTHLLESFTFAGKSQRFPVDFP